MSELSSRVLMGRLLKSYKCLYDLGFSHNDIKPENIVIDSEFNCKLIDFGFSNYVQDNCSCFLKGTAMYSAPEILREEVHNT